MKPFFLDLVKKWIKSGLAPAGQADAADEAAETFWKVSDGDTLTFPQFRACFPDVRSNRVRDMGAPRGARDDSSGVRGLRGASASPGRPRTGRGCRGRW